MDSVRVNAQKPYDVIIGKNAVESLGQLLKERHKACKVALLSDDIVAKLYMPRIKKIISDAGFEVCPITFLHGEDHKSLESLSFILSSLASVPLSRNDILVALGGGITGDLGGFAASCYLRGISYVNIPTTLLSQIDSSIGGKTAVNLPEGKNLCGSFCNPSLVVCDPSFLESLSEERLKDGLGECIKYACAFDKSLFPLLEKGKILENAEEIILKCLKIKKWAVENDEKDFGVRRKLNFGHTIAHAIEKCSSYSIPHGQAVAIGAVMIEKAAYEKGLAQKDVYLYLIKKLKELSMEYEVNYPKEALLETALRDKKIKGDTLSLIIAPKLGESIVYDINKNELLSWL